MRSLIVSDGTKCVGCGICELVCSAEKERVYNPTKSRINVVRLGQFMMAITCRFCEEAPCVAACPRGALLQAEETGIVTVDVDKCIGCGWCIKACEFGAINIWRHKMHICDLCKGKPECVKACPVQALELTPLDQLKEKARDPSMKSPRRCSDLGLIITSSLDFEERWPDIIEIIRKAIAQEEQRETAHKKDD